MFIFSNRTLERCVRLVQKICCFRTLFVFLLKVSLSLSLFFWVQDAKAICFRKGRFWLRNCEVRPQQKSLSHTCQNGLLDPFRFCWMLTSLKTSKVETLRKRQVHWFHSFGFLPATLLEVQLKGWLKSAGTYGSLVRGSGVAF